MDITIIYFNNLDSKGQKLNYNSTKIDNFIPNKPCVFIIHGWQTSFEYESWLDELKDNVLRVNNGSVNVFVVDWSKTASNPLYPLSAANTRTVGASIGYFTIKTLVPKYKVKCDNIQVFGHSLGKF